MREKLTKDRQFHNQIFQLQKRWLVKASKTNAKQVFSPIAYSSNAILGNASLIIDLSKSSTILPLYSYIPVVLLRSQDNELDMKIPAICNYGKRVILASRVIRDGIFSNFDQILESAQASVFNLELFDLFVACLMSNKCVERDIHVLSYTMHTVTVKIGSILQISLSRVPDSRNVSEFLCNFKSRKSFIIKLTLCSFFYWISYSGILNVKHISQSSQTLSSTLP